MKQLLPVFLLLFLFFPGEIAGQQKQGAWWYFGGQAGLTFNTEPPSPDFSGQSNSYMGCATVSGPNGNLLFYADGSKVYNRFHQVMPNGSNLAPLGINGQTNVIIVQKPGSQYLYYLFSASRSPNAATQNFTYSLIDMRLDSGKGDIISATKNTSAFSTPIVAKFTAAMHANNQDVWLIVHDQVGTNFYSFLISPNGISPPTISSIGFPYTTSYNIGVLKSSPNSELIGDAIPQARVTQLLDLNRTSGVLTNPRTFSFPVNNYRLPNGIAFSPDNSRLYLGDRRNIYQYNLLASSFAAVLSSKTAINSDTTIFHYDMQLGMNGKLYLLPEDGPDRLPNYNFNINKYLSVINCPNALGTACGFQDTAIYIGRPGGLNLPALNQTLFRNANFLQVTAAQPYVCIGDSIKLSAFGAGADNFTWLPANGITPKNSPEIWVKPTTTTTYTVTGINQCGQSSTVSITVPVVPPAYANAGPDKVICTTGSVQVGVQPQTGFTYTWNSSPFLSDTTLANPTFTATNNTTTDQVYQLVVTLNGPGASCGKLTDTVEVLVKAPIIVNAGNQVNFCSGTTAQLNPQQFDSTYTYSWSPATGLSDPNVFAPTITLQNSSNQTNIIQYTLTATSNGCSAISRVRVVVLPQNQPIISGPASVCPGAQQISYTIQNQHPGSSSVVYGVVGSTSHSIMPLSSQWALLVNWGAASTSAHIWIVTHNNFGCASDTVFFPVTINTLLATETPKGDTLLCANDRLNQVYQIRPTNGSVYTWGFQRRHHNRRPGQQPGKYKLAGPWAIQTMGAGIGNHFYCAMLWRFGYGARYGFTFPGYHAHHSGPGIGLPPDNPNL